jgi:hypothetical protein
MLQHPTVKEDIAKTVESILSALEENGAATDP